MPRPIEALIHTEALAQNLLRARHMAPDAKVWAVIKADAYGHRIEHAFEGLRGADGFALLDLAEAERVRRLGWRGPILLLEGCFEARDLETCSRLNLWHAVHREEQIERPSNWKREWEKVNQERSERRASSWSCVAGRARPAGRACGRGGANHRERHRNRLAAL